MRFNLDEALGIHEQALYLRARRAAVLANNLANVDTPNYKARDIDFRQILQQVDSNKIGSNLSQTHKNHFPAAEQGVQSSELLYRHPMQPSLDGNTVDGQIEKAEFAQNTLQYQASLTFLTGRIKGIMTALQGSS